MHEAEPYWTCSEKVGETYRLYRDPLTSETIVGFNLSEEHYGRRLSLPLHGIIAVGDPTNGYAYRFQVDHRQGFIPIPDPLHNEVWWDLWIMGFEYNASYAGEPVDDPDVAQIWSVYGQLTPPETREGRIHFWLMHEWHLNGVDHYFSGTSIRNETIFRGRPVDVTKTTPTDVAYSGRDFLFEVKVIPISDNYSGISIDTSLPSAACAASAWGLPLVSGPSTRFA